MLSGSDFSPVTMADRHLFLSHYRKFPPVHSDNTFTNMICWNPYAHYRYALLKGNLLISSTDHDRINAQWTDLILRKRSFPPNLHWTEQTKQMFFMASYDIDRFRSFVFGSSFLKKFPQEPQRLEKIKTDDVALLEFRLKGLKGRVEEAVADLEKKV